jgi:shikimate dehydrogenase
MYPNTGISPVDLSLFPHLEGVLDVVYNPSRTQLLLDAEDRGIVSMSGLWMLVAQAKESAEWFQGNTITDEAIGKIHSLLRAQMENIILIGMPGCGKSTIGKRIAAATGKKFTDSDERIEELAGKSIPRIFAEDGEKVFRNWETQAIAELGKQSGLIIATGGGCVTKARNYPLLHQNGTVFWLQRDLSVLPTDGRPLSQSNKLSDMYAVRLPMYQQFADHIINNSGTITDTVNAILEVIQ